jgi:hypothetical protein
LILKIKTLFGSFLVIFRFGYHYPEKIRFEVQENELWTVVRQPWTISRSDGYSI